MRRASVGRSRRTSEGRVKENSGVKKKILASAKSLLLEFAEQKKRGVARASHDAAAR